MEGLVPYSKIKDKEQHKSKLTATYEEHLYSKDLPRPVHSTTEIL
jgi:hypothetical protein